MATTPVWEPGLVTVTPAKAAVPFGLPRPLVHARAMFARVGVRAVRGAHGHRQGHTPRRWFGEAALLPPNTVHPGLW
jgi:hypothetical protein